MGNLEGYVEKRMEMCVDDWETLADVVAAEGRIRKMISSMITSKIKIVWTPASDVGDWINDTSDVVGVRDRKHDYLRIPSAKLKNN
ncbi:hypothetical protein Bca4012_025842 [Brassica carinata]